ncbi:MAG: phosphate/phosphite/phosphonate ABC transporter substrate-binding protein [Chloroflexota bacterium]
MTVETRRISRRAAVAALSAGTVALLTAACSQIPTGSSLVAPAAPAAKGGTIPKMLNVSIIPAEDGDAMLKRFQPLMDYLKQALGMDVKGFAGADYTAAVEAMRAKKVEMGFFGPFSYLLAVEMAGARPVVMPGTAEGKPNTYHSLILAGGGTDIKSLEDLRGKSFSFSDPASTSGNLIPRSIIVKAGLDPEKDMRPIFAGGHDASILAVHNGKVDAGACADSQYNRMIEAKVIDPNKLRLVVKSEPIPNSPVAMREDIDQGFRDRVRDALLAAHETLPGDLMKAVVGGEKNRYIPADDSLYNPLRETARLLKLDLKALQ